MNEDIDQMLTTAQAAMTFAMMNWTQFEAWLLEMFGRVPVSAQTLQAQALQVGLMIDPERLPE